VCFLQHIQNFYNRTFGARLAGSLGASLNSSGNGTAVAPGLDDFTLTFLWSLTTTLYVIGGMFGAYFAGFIADRVGRQVFSVFVSAVFILSPVCWVWQKSISPND